MTSIKSPTAKFLESLQWYVLLLLIFSPKVVISAIPGLSSALRIDIFLSLIFTFIWFFQMAVRRDFFTKNGVILLSLLLLTSAYILNSKNSIVAIGQSMLYISLGGAFIHGASVSEEVRSKKIRILFRLLCINILIHIIFYALGIETYYGTYAGDSGMEENYYIFGLYGISSMPFQFAIYIAAYIFILIHGNMARKKFIAIGWLVACIALLTSDSRISLVALILAVFGFWTVLISPVLFFISQLIQTKSTSVISNFGEVSGDPSLAMRLVNIQHYLDWVTFETFAFGGGAQSFLEFSEQYGFPGPLDMGYVRLMSEFGLFGLLLILITLRHFIIKRFSVRQAGLGVALIFCAVYSVFNEGLLATRSGHLMLVVIGLLYFKPIGIRMLLPSQNQIRNI